LAFDPNLFEFVLWGEDAKDRATNNVWVSSESYTPWVNATGRFSPLPPPLLYAGLTWDPDWGGLLLTGGVYASGDPSNETWLFDGNWINETSAVGAGPYSDGGSWAYDSDIDGGVLVGVRGCPTGPSGPLYSQTWTLPGPSAKWENETAAYGVPGNSCTAGSGMDYDPISHQLVLYGGLTRTGTSLFERNDTWTLTGSTPTWVNVTATASANPTRSPPATAWGAQTWDGQLNVTILFGGVATGPEGPGSTWAFLDGEWHSADTLFGANLSGPDEGAWEVVPSDSSLIAPLVVGGATPGFQSENTSWVLELPPIMRVYSISPDPIDTGQTASMIGGASLGTGSGFAMGYAANDSYFLNLATGSGGGSYSYLRNNTFDIRFTYTAGPLFDPYNYPTGSWPITFRAVDFYGVTSTVVVPQTVNPVLSTNITTSPALTELGSTPATLTYSAEQSGGSGPYFATWTFGDGSTSNSMSGEHNYTESGTFDGWVVIRDSGGGVTNSSFHIVVEPALEAVASTNVTATDVGRPIEFTGAPAGGTGSYRDAQWNFGDGSTYLGNSTSHGFARPGSYVSVYAVNDSEGYGQSREVPVVINPALTGSVAASNVTPSTSSVVALGAMAINGTGPYSYSWSFGDGSPALGGPVVGHQFSHAGSYTVTCEIEDAVHERVTASVRVTVTASPVSSPNPYAGLTSGAGPYVVGGLIAVTVVLAVLLVASQLRARKSEIDSRRDTPSPEPDSGNPPPPG